MTKLFATALLLCTFAVFPAATPVLADSSTNALCGPDAPEGYKRPGGFCEQLDDKGSMLDGPDCNYELKKEILFMLERGQTVIVADYCYTGKKESVL